MDTNISYEAVDALRAHPLIMRLRGERITRRVLGEFVAQWALTAHAHKEALLCLPAVDGLPLEIRTEVIANLHEEFGSGDPDQAHVRLLEVCLEELALPMPTRNAAIPAVTQFGKDTRAHWDGTHSAAVAVGYHAALERIAGVIHAAGAEAVRKAGLSPTGRKYFDLHATVELEHAEAANKSVNRMLEESPGNVIDIWAGIREGGDAVRRLLDGLHRDIFAEAA